MFRVYICMTATVLHGGNQSNPHYNGVIMGAIVYSTVYSFTDQRKHQRSASLAFVCGEFTGDRWIPRTNGQWRGKCFHLMTSSCHPGRSVSYIYHAILSAFSVNVSGISPILDEFALVSGHFGVRIMDQMTKGGLSVSAGMNPVI